MANQVSMRFFTATGVVCALLGVLLPMPAGAQAYPSKPIHIIAPFPAGGGYDFLSRLVGQKLAEAWGQPVVVENRVGANGNIGVEAAAKSPPDGYMLLMSGNGPHGLNVGLYPKLPYDPINDFEPISRVATQPNLFVVHASVAANSLAEFIQMAKARPGQINYGHNGSGSPQQLAGEMLKKMGGLNMVHVPYKGAAPALTALLAGEVAAAFNAIVLTLPHIQSGKLRALGIASSKRSALAPDIATMAEQGFPIDVDSWFGLFVPAGTPKDIVGKLNAEVVRILNLPDTRERTRSQGYELAGNTPEQFSVFVKAEIARLSKAVKELGVSID